MSEEKKQRLIYQKNIKISKNIKKIIARQKNSQYNNE